MADPCYLAADFGASGGKMVAARFDGSKLLLEDYLTFPNNPVSLGSSLYWDLFSLYESILHGVEQYRSRGMATKSLGIDTWGATYGFLDHRGRLLEPVFHYRDIRTADVMEPLFAQMSRKTLFTLSGCQCNRTYTLPQLYSCVLNSDPCLESARQMLLLPDLLGYFLTGVSTSERTIAGTSALLEPDQGAWSQDILHRFQIPTHFLTPLVDAGTPKGELIGTAAERIGGDIQIVATTAHDSAAAVAAIPGFGPGRLYVSIGTNVNMGIELDHPVLTEEAFAGGFKHTGGFGRTIILYRDFSAFWLINELRTLWRQTGVDYSFDQLHALAENAAGFGSIVDTEHPSLNTAEGNIQEKMTVYLLETGQTVPATPGDWVRCIFESIAVKIAHVATLLRNSLGIPLREAFVINGGSRNTLLVQMISDATALPVKAGMPYGTLAGNLLTQLYSDRSIASLEEMREVSANSFTMQAYAPQPDERWQKLLFTARKHPDWR